ncbi:MAG: hypothetical protein ACJ760_12070 [Thermoleophilaceae bacterium]
MNLQIDAERGPILAAGGVLLACAVGMLAVRLESSWGKGVHLVVELAAFVVVFGLAWLSPLRERPLAYQSTLAVTGLVLLVVVLFRLADVFGVDNTGNSGTLIWISAIFTAVAAAAALRFESVASALFAGIGAVVFVIAVIDKVFDPNGVTTFRWIFLLLVIAFGVAAAGLARGPRPGFAVAAVDVAGLVLIALGVSFAANGIATALNPLSAGAGIGENAPGFGWKIVLLVGSLAVVAYAAQRRMRGPGFIGGIALALAVVLIAVPDDDQSIVGWPLLLLLAGGATLALGLRPPDGAGPGGGGTVAAAGGPGGVAPVPPPAPAPDTREQPPPAGGP